MSCGVDRGIVIFPNDPDSASVSLSAQPAFGGIDLSWTYPNVNPQAVAYFIIYRGTSPDFNLAVNHDVVTAGSYYDRVEVVSDTLYYYWVKWVSINGTVGDLIGPASATARPTIAQTLEMLTGQIRSSELALSLTEQINYTQTVDADLQAEKLARQSDYTTLANQLAQLDTDMNGVATLLSSEVTRLENDDTAIISQVNTLAATVDGNTVALQQEATVRATADNELYAQYTVKADANGHVAGFGLANTPSEDDGTNSSQFLIQADRFAVSHPSNYWRASTAYSAGTYAQPSSQANSTGLIYEATTGGTSDVAEPAWPTVVGNTVVDGTVVWTARNPNTRTPFIISNGEVFISEAAIEKLTFSKLRDEAGNFLVQNGQVKAQYLDAANLYVDWANITNVTIQTADIATAAITNAKIADAAITNIKIGDAAVNTLQLAGQAVTIPASAYTAGQFSVSVGVWTNAQAVTISSSGSPVFVTGTLHYHTDTSGTQRTYPLIRMLRDGVIIYDQVQLEDSFNGSVVTIACRDVPTAGSHTYALQVYRPGNDGAYVAKRSLMVLETKR